jgi:hypothetical protein
LGGRLTARSASRTGDDSTNVSYERAGSTSQLVRFVGVLILGPVAVWNVRSNGFALATPLWGGRKHDELLARIDVPLKMAANIPARQQQDTEIREVQRVDSSILDDLAPEPIDASDTDAIYDFIVESHDTRTSPCHRFEATARLSMGSRLHHGPFLRATRLLASALSLLL